MNVLVFNAGSSSLKYELFDMAVSRSLLRGRIERIGEAGSDVADHTTAFKRVASSLQADGLEAGDLASIGHRVVHGGEAFVQPVAITGDVIKQIEVLTPLAPLHNAANLAGIKAARLAFPDASHFAVFDTAFHAKMPDRARRYAIDNCRPELNRIYRYGFHGISYQYVARRTAEMLSKPIDSLNIIALHLGNGASACAIERGKSVDTTMGFTPLEGLVMGTRSGDIDPAVVFHLYREAGMSIDEIDDLLNRRSGLNGMCGCSDAREVLALAEDGDHRAQLALDLFCYRLHKAIGAYAAVLTRVDALVFTAGIGENQPEVRRRICAGLKSLGITIDGVRNRKLTGTDGFVDRGSNPRVLVVRTNEALEIASQCIRL